MVLADTNVLFSFAVDNDWSERARELGRRSGDWRSESHALVELTNVLVRYVRNHLMTDEEAFSALELVESALRGKVIAADHRAAYAAAREFKVSAYDARFLVAAHELGLRLTTEDVKLRRAAPELTQSLDEALAAA